MRRSLPSIVSTGLVALDVVLSLESDEPIFQTGGTCGNVSAILSYLGWDSSPITRFDNSSVSKWIANDLKQCGVETKYLSVSPGAAPPVIVQKIKKNAQGNIRHSFSSRCPSCRERLPSYRPVTRAALLELAEEIETPKVFFFDRVSSGALALARLFREQGSLVVFEPAGIGAKHLFSHALKVAHIVKYSEDTKPSFPATTAELPVKERPLLEIETRGAQGLRYLLRNSIEGRGSWKNLPAIPATSLRDAAGSGDWCTSGLVCELGADGADGLRNQDAQSIQKALRFAQALSAINCGYEGARGAMYSKTSQSLVKQARSLVSGSDSPMGPAKQLRKALAPPHSYCC